MPEGMPSNAQGLNHRVIHETRLPGCVSSTRRLWVKQCSFSKYLTYYFYVVTKGGED